MSKALLCLGYQSQVVDSCLELARFLIVDMKQGILYIPYIVYLHLPNLNGMFCSHSSAWLIFQNCWKSTGDF